MFVINGLLWIIFLSFLFKKLIENANYAYFKHLKILENTKSELHSANMISFLNILLGKFKFLYSVSQM